MSDTFVDGKHGSYSICAEEELASSYDDFYQHEYLVGTGRYNVTIFAVINREKGGLKELARFRRYQTHVGSLSEFKTEWLEEFVRQYESCFPDTP